MMRVMTVKNLTIPILVAMSVVACGRNKVRTYTEEIQTPPQMQGAGTPAMLADLPEDHPMRAAPLTVEPVPENLPPNHPTRTMRPDDTPMMAQLPEDHPMRAAPLTVDPVPENLPPNHPTLGTQPGQAVTERDAASAANMMRGREAEVPPPPAADDLAWVVPDGWRQQPGTGMRLAAFTIDGDNSGALTTLIVLGGAAGNVDANIQRWRQQMDLPPNPPSPPEHVEANLEFVFVDLVEESLAAGKDVTTVGAIFDLDGRTAFLKFVGPTEVLSRQRLPFVLLASSLRLVEDGQ